MLERMWRNGNPLALLVGMQTGAATLKTMWRFLKKLKIELPYDPAIALLGIYPKDTGVLIHRGTCTPMFIATLSTIAKLWKEPECPLTDEWIKMMWCVYTTEYYLAIRENEILPFATTWLELGCIMLSEISQRKTNTVKSYVEFKKQNNMGRLGGAVG